MVVGFYHSCCWWSNHDGNQKMQPNSWNYCLPVVGLLLFFCRPLHHYNFCCSTIFRWTQHPDDAYRSCSFDVMAAWSFIWSSVSLLGVGMMTKSWIPPFSIFGFQIWSTWLRSEITHTPPKNLSLRLFLSVALGASPSMLQRLPKRLTPVVPLSS